MTDIVEYQDANVVAAYKNTSTMIAQWATDVDTSSDVTDLTTIFGQLGSGDFLDICNDGDTKMYVAFGASAGTIDTAATTGVTVCWPIPANTTVSWRVQEGNTFLHYRMASSATTLRVRRSSTPPGIQPSLAFKGPSTV